MGVPKQPAPGTEGGRPPASGVGVRGTWRDSRRGPPRPSGTRGARCVFGVLGVLGLLLVADRRAAAQTQLAPLSAEETQVFQALPEEKPYNVRIHFLRSNERRHDVLFSALRHLGGGYIGVGADQNYTLAAVARAELVWLIDIDGDVVQWHRIYAALIPQAETPADLIALLAAGKEAQVKAALAARWPEDEAKRLWPTFLRYRGLLGSHLRAEREVRQRGRPVTWVSDLELYKHVRALMQARRVFARVGDLHGETMLIAIGAAARRTGHLVRTLYLSNVEQWFRYSPQFRRNLAGLPRDDQTVVVRTLARGELPAPDQDRWHFSVQTLDDFLFRMESAQPPAQGVLDLMPAMARSRQPGLRGLSWLGAVRAQPRPRLEWALLPPLRDDQAPPPPPPRPLVAWTVLPPLRPGPPLPTPPPPRALIEWKTLPPLRSGSPLAPSLAGAPLAPPLRSGPPLAPLLAGAPGAGSGPGLPPLLTPSALTPWQKLPPLRELPPAALTAGSWQVLPPLRGAEVGLPSTAGPDLSLQPPLPPPGGAPPSPSSGRLGSRDSLPPLRDAAVAPQRRVPWRRLPQLRDGLAPTRLPTG